TPTSFSRARSTASPVWSRISGPNHRWYGSSLEKLRMRRRLSCPSSSRARNWPMLRVARSLFLGSFGVVALLGCDLCAISKNHLLHVHALFAAVGQHLGSLVHRLPPVLAALSADVLIGFL